MYQYFGSACGRHQVDDSYYQLSCLDENRQKPSEGNGRCMLSRRPGDECQWTAVGSQCPGEMVCKYPANHSKAVCRFKEVNPVNKIGHGCAIGVVRNMGDPEHEKDATTQGNYGICMVRHENCFMARLKRGRDKSGVRIIFQIFQNCLSLFVQMSLEKLEN